MATPPVFFDIGAHSEDFEVTAPTDPTGSSIEWAVTALAGAPSAWVAGSWGTWDATTGKVTATTPRIGGDAAAQIDPGGTGDYYLWARWTVGSEVVPDRVPIRVI